MDVGVDEPVDGRWMTHAELAQARGISTASAIKLALRHRWRKQKDNRGTLRCYVPSEFTNPNRDTGAVTTADGGVDASAAIAALQAAVTMLGDQLSHERTRADVAQGRLDDLQAKLVETQAELAAAMDRADQSAAELEAAQIALGEAQADVAELRQAEEARKGRGLVARLRSALRGE
jgi:chromosome condensin MukBEF ATPase and DNA-binding subunit MukB